MKVLEGLSKVVTGHPDVFQSQAGESKKYVDSEGTAIQEQPSMEEMEGKEEYVEEPLQYLPGVKITEGLLKKHATNARHKDTTSQEFFLKLTHLSLNTKKISTMLGI
jgi:hypothetical protein